jgi:uncharacterized iron-regulated protein
MKKSLTLLILSLMSLMFYGQILSSNFKIITVNKKIKEFPDTMDLSSPLKACVTINYLTINGKDRLWREVSTVKFKASMPDSTTTDSKVPEDIKSLYLETIIKEIIYFKDSIACSISEVNQSHYLIRFYNLESGKWVNSGEDEKKSLEIARQHFEKYADQKLYDLRKIVSIASFPSDTTSFTKYLKGNASEPKEFVLDKLKKEKLVMYGEIHRRKWSWDFCTELINDKHFAEYTGVIFMEMASNKQKEIDHFLSNDNIDKELLLNIFRDYMTEGWNDKGKFDFLISVWHLNKKLPDHKKVRVIAVDTPRTYSEEGLKDERIDRDAFMASKISNYLESNTDKRNALFIVGSGHICKTRSSAGAILTKMMANNCYTIFTHCPRVDNFIIVHERIRHGMFDFAFYKNGDKPVAFELKNSPFGKEPFDGLYFDGSGTFRDNFDGYIFLGSLDNEPNGEQLLEMYDDKFILEIDRRYKLQGSSFAKEWDLKELSRKAVIDKILSEHTTTRWERYVRPLKNGKIVQ